MDRKSCHAFGGSKSRDRLDKLRGVEVIKKISIYIDISTARKQENKCKGKE